MTAHDQGPDATPEEVVSEAPAATDDVSPEPPGEQSGDRPADAPAPGGAAEQGAAEQRGAEQGGAEESDPLEVARAELAERTLDLQRLQAEYVNYKRRVDRDRELVRENALVSVLSALLPVLDDIDRARDHGELEGGFKAVADSLIGVVSGLGLQRFGESGDEFDPNLHEALMHGHSPDVTTTTCQDIVQAGYRIGERVVRAAKVTVVDPEPSGSGDAG